jgi:hypothetical protein
MTSTSAGRDAADTADPAVDPPPTPPRRRIPTFSLVLLGLAAGALIGLLGAWAARGHGEKQPSTISLAPVQTGLPPDHQANARAFITAWQRFREGTFRADYTFVRRFADGRTLEAQRSIVQQPPRRVVRQLGGVVSLGEEGQSSCDTVDDKSVCTPPAGVDYEASVQDEMVAWATAFAGDKPAYLVDVPEPGCFELSLAQPLPAAPYGDAARFCFDQATGALQQRQIVRQTAVDTEVAVQINAIVTDADFGSAGK